MSNSSVLPEETAAETAPEPVRRRRARAAAKKDSNGDTGGRPVPKKTTGPAKAREQQREEILPDAANNEALAVLPADDADGKPATPAKKVRSRSYKGGRKRSRLAEDDSPAANCPESAQAAAQEDMPVSVQAAPATDANAKSAENAADAGLDASIKAVEAADGNAEAAENKAAKTPKKERGTKQTARARGRKKSSEAEQKAALLSAVEIAARLTATLALPPGRSSRKTQKGGMRQDARQPAARMPHPEKSSAKMAQAPKTAVASAKTNRMDAPRASKRMFISVLQGEQIEVALAENGSLLEYYLDMLHQRKIKGNIYKGVVHNIDPNLQAAFVNYGAGKNGFLQIDQIHPEYWQSPWEPGKDRKFPPIQKIIKTGQELLVQVVKEPAGSKGAFLTTWLSLAGRFLVLTPGQEQIGVSRKVTEPEERARLRQMMGGIDPGNGFGVIVRTVGEGATKTTLKTDLQYLKRLWREIRKRGTEVSAPALIHQEPGLPERSVRDYLTDDVTEIWVDNEEEAEHVRNMAALLFPRKKDLVHLYTDMEQSIWDKFHLQSQVEQIYAREVHLPSGGRLVFDQTEALMAIDINSGKISGKGNFEAMAFKTNMEAAQAIARHLRLRDIGGQVVIDFIEMKDKKHVLEVEKTLRQAMKSDRARHDVARMSSFGLLELVRQRMGSSALSICLETCEFCGGTGLRRNLEWRALQALGELRRRMRASAAPKYVFETSTDLGMYLLNYKRDALRMLERDYDKVLEIKVRA